MSSIRSAIALTAALGVLTACAGDADEPLAASDEPLSADAATSTAPPSTTMAATTMPSTTSPSTTAPPPTTAPAEASATSTAVPDTTAPPTTEPCGSQCPPSDADQAVLDAFFAAYDGGDWDTFLAALATDDPTWQFSPNQTQPAELMRYDLIWAAAMGQTTEPESCVDQYGTIRCTVTIEDDLHRALAPYGFPASRCVMSMTIEDGGVVPRDFSGFDCFRFYDFMMHLYGEWFAEQYPDQPRIDGFHYRAWNQEDETAGARAAEHLDEFIEAVIVPHVEDGGELIDLRVRGGH